MFLGGLGAHLIVLLVCGGAVILCDITRAVIGVEDCAWSDWRCNVLRTWGPWSNRSHWLGLLYCFVEFLYPVHGCVLKLCTLGQWKGKFIPMSMEVSGPGPQGERVISAQIGFRHLFTYVTHVLLENGRMSYGQHP